MASEEGQVAVGFSAEASESYLHLPSEHRTIVDRRLKELAREPERAPIRGLSPKGRRVYIAQAIVDSERAYRIDFAIDELMQQRAKVPAIAVRRLKLMQRR